MCELLSVLCSPDMNAVQHLEMKQVGARAGERMGEGREKWKKGGGRRERDRRWLCELLSVSCSEHYATFRS